jgi:2'-5' RNA ligase
VDAADTSVSESVMIALLPTSAEWCRIALPHMTLVYAGDKSKLKVTDFNEIAKDASMLAMLSGVIGLRVIDRETFGPPEDQVDVFKLQPTSELFAMRRAVESWNASEFPFNPHVTIGPVGSFVEFPPQSIIFDRIMVGWGDESLIFWLKR